MIAVVCQGDHRVAAPADDIIEVPAVDEFLQPIVASIPLQLWRFTSRLSAGATSTLFRAFAPVDLERATRFVAVFDGEDAVGAAEQR